MFSGDRRRRSAQVGEAAREVIAAWAVVLLVLAIAASVLAFNRHAPGDRRVEVLLQSWSELHASDGGALPAIGAGSPWRYAPIPRGEDAVSIARAAP